VSEAKKSFDFLVIGAMRSATTTLHELLKQHPEIYLPIGKEVPYFADHTAYEKGLEDYLKNNFSKATPEQKWGTISPSYMFNLSNLSTDEVAERIKLEAPDVKLIAILRNPIDRAHSHYKFARRHGFTEKELEESFQDILSSDAATLDKHKTEHEYTYLARSKYGAGLKPYYDRFKPENILVLFTDELEKRPVQTLKKIYRFIGVDPDIVPDNAGKVFHKGGSKARVSWLAPGNLVKHKALRKSVRTTLPYHVRKRIEMWILIWNTKPDKKSDALSKAMRAQLVEYFSADVRLLEKLSGRKTPWWEWS
jgi:hypothetical protein